VEEEDGQEGVRRRGLGTCGAFERPAPGGGVAAVADPEYPFRNIEIVPPSTQDREPMQDSFGGTARGGPSLWNRIRHIHPGLVLAALDLIGLGIAAMLSYEELRPGGVVPCPQSGFLSGCHAVQDSQYSRPFFGIPVAVYGVLLSITLFWLAIYWWRTNNYMSLVAHYVLSLVGVAFEGWFQYAQIFLIGAICVWCESYGISLILRFVIALWVYLRTPRPDEIEVEQPA
jgi:uncharacterized membrane protein